GVRELGVLDAHLAQHALEDVDLARVDREARNVALGAIARQVRLGGGEDVGLARGDIDVEHAPPLAELNDDWDAHSSRWIRQGEGAVDARGRADDGGLRHAALIAGRAARDRLNGSARDVHDGVVDWI